MGRKRDMLQQCDDVGRRRDDSEEEKGSKWHQLDRHKSYWDEKIIIHAVDSAATNER
jgi:hypothetical protein